MALGKSLIGNARSSIGHINPVADISVIKAVTDLDYINAITDIHLDYDSKNKLPDDIVTVDDSAGFTRFVAWERAFTEQLLAIQELIAISNAKILADSVANTDQVVLAPQLNKADSVATADALNLIDTTKVLADISVINELVSLGTTKPFSDSFSIADALGLQINIQVANSITAADGYFTDYGGAINTAPLNTHALLVDPDRFRTDNITVTIT
jgi:hypothetical protein|tara:strand:+ start:136 stop:774 length:639 start_codon:yes stop_codon:yes gene_type:complete